jgi:hypothetical protein
MKRAARVSPFLIATVLVGWLGWAAPASAAKARVEVTGQTACFGEGGEVIACATSGQDGELQAGVSSPTQRFRDRGDGTVLDTLTGLIWLKTANCFGEMLWVPALVTANTLASGACGLTDRSEAGDWRLPNVKELQSLIDFGQSEPALPPGHPFTDVQPVFYWSSTSLVGSPAAAWDVSLREGVTTNDSKDGGLFLVWPVRGGP